MHYRIVCSTEDVVRYITDDTIITESNDIYEQDDFIVFVNEQIIVICFLNVNMKNIFCSANNKKSIVGIKLIVEDNIEKLQVNDLIDRYTIGGKKMTEEKLTEINVAALPDEEQMYSDDDLYNINSWGADLSFREIISVC